MAVTMEDYASQVEIAWCPGCGNFGILEAVKTTLVELNLPPHKTLLVSGIGQGPKLPHYLKANVFDGLHGREVASATAAKLAANDLTVLVHAGDGGAYGEGGNHFLSAIRRNIDLTLVVHDNRVYGLTKGQASPTTESGTPAKLQPHGLAVQAMNPLALALSQGCGFVAQGFAGQKDHLAELLQAAVVHRGFSLVNVLQPCVTWDKVHTYDYYNQRCYHLGEDHDQGELAAALDLVMRRVDERIPLGVIYQKERPSYDEVVLKGIEHPLRDRGVDPGRAADLFDRFS